jgi:hypothetical protein
MKYKQLRRHWHKACDHVGVAGVTIHDLRHIYGQKLTDENLHESKDPGRSAASYAAHDEPIHHAAIARRGCSHHRQAAS